MINYLVQSGFPHLRATSVCPNVLQYTRVYLNHFTNRRRRFYHLRKRFELQDALRRARYFLRGAEGASTIRKNNCTLDA